MSIDFKRKGSQGEREFFKAIGDSLGIDIVRNLEQARGGGHDHAGLVFGFAIEVKRGERLRLPEWWKQAQSQALAAGGRPALAYRQNRKQWLIQARISDLFPVTLESDHKLAGRAFPPQAMVTMTLTGFLCVLHNFKNHSEGSASYVLLAA